MNLEKKTDQVDLLNPISGEPIGTVTGQGLFPVPEGSTINGCRLYRLELRNELFHLVYRNKITSIIGMGVNIGFKRFRNTK